MSREADVPPIIVTPELKAKWSKDEARWAAEEKAAARAAAGITEYTTNELLATAFPPLIQHVEFFVAEEGITLLIGRRGVGKTFMLLELLHLIAAGRPFGPYATSKSEVAFFSQEMSERGINRRLLSTRRSRPEYTHVHHVFGLKFDASSDEAIEPLTGWLTDNPNVRVIGIDALRHIKGSAEENSNKEMGDVLDRLAGVAQRFKVAIILLHHMGKPGQEGKTVGGRGASVIEDVPEVVLELAKERDSQTGFITNTKNRYFDEQPDLQYTIVYDEDTRCTLLEIEKREENPAHSDDLAFMLGKMREQGSIDYLKTEIMALCSYTDATARRRIGAAVRSRALSESDSGPGTKKRYKLNS